MREAASSLPATCARRSATRHLLPKPTRMAVVSAMGSARAPTYGMQVGCVHGRKVCECVWVQQQSKGRQGLSCRDCCTQVVSHYLLACC